MSYPTACSKRYYGILVKQGGLTLAVACLITLFLLLPLCVVADEQEKKEDNEIQQLSFQNFDQLASDVLLREIELQHNLSTLHDHSQFQKDLNAIIEELAVITERIRIISAGDKVSPREIFSLQGQLNYQQVVLEQINLPVNRDLDRMVAWSGEWAEFAERLNTYSSMSDDTTLSTVIETELDDLFTTARTAQVSIERKMDLAVEVSSAARKANVVLYNQTMRLDRMLKEGIRSRNFAAAPLLFSGAFWKMLNQELWREVGSSLVTYLEIQKQSLLRSSQTLLSIVFIASLVVLAFRWCAVKLQYAGYWQGLGRRPMAASLLVSLHTFILFYTIGNIPKPSWNSLVILVLLIAVMRLSKILVSDSKVNFLVIRLTLFMLVTFLLHQLNLPAPIIRLYVFYSVLFGLVYCILHLYRNRKKSSTSMSLWFYKGVVLYLLILLAMLIFGMDELAVQIFISMVTSGVYGVILWMFYMLIIIGIEAGLKLAPNQLFSTNSKSLTNHLRPVLALFCFVLFTVFSMAKWYIYPSEAIAFIELISFDFSFLGLEISMKFIMLCGLVVYLTYLCSKAIQGFLKQVVLPDYSIDIGVQYSITRLVNYFIVLTGLIILLSILGVELTKLTIFGSALGVGIGFGLQAIVNNFASGLILLFERPVKMGDMVQLGTDIGEVKNVGLRSTLIQTLDNAEIVVPNSDLITHQITNWTLSEKQSRISVKIGAAYGSDIEDILGILKRCADEHPQVLTRPEPKPLFLAFGESSLEFELRAWIQDFNQRYDVLSELNQEIASEFNEHGIQIPFPQRDLHIKTIDDEIQQNRLFTGGNHA